MSNEVVDYIKINLSRIQKAIKAEKPQFDVSKSFDNAENYKIYKRIPVEDIEILISNTDRTTDIKTRYDKALPIQDYIKENKEDFTKLLEKTNIEKIQKIEKLQESFKDKIPFFAKYDENYLWQIYYSSIDKKYFMLFPANEGETEVLMFLIKQKLSKEISEIYVPICKEDYDEQIITNKKISDIENYIWVFTGEWPKILEIHDKDEKIYIIGKTKINEGLKTDYRIVFNNKEEAESYYTLLKALFILTTETKYAYKFLPVIDKDGSLVFECKDKIVTYENIQKFITDETALEQDLKYEYKKQIEKNKEKLEKLKEIVGKQNEVYNKQEKQILNFMNCRTSFFKKVRFFFKSNKKFSIDSKRIIKNIEQEVEKVENFEAEQVELKESVLKDIPNIFTIADLVKTTMEVKAEQNENKVIIDDLKALKLKHENMKRKIENADKYLDEIEKHKKNLLDFWKFTNKDNQSMLQEGIKEEVQEKKNPIFSLDEDLENLTISADNLLRKKLSKEECDAIYVATKLLDGINSVVTRSSTYVLDEEYEQLKSNYKKDDKKTNIFGGLVDDYTKVKVLNNNEHRENHKDLYNILRFNETTTLEDFKERMKELGRLVAEAFQKITSLYDMEVYYAKRNKGFVLGEINPYKLLEDETIDKIYKMKANKDTHLIYFSNIIFYDNNNKTLPSGMDETTEIILKVGENKKISDSTINVLVKKDLFNVKIRKIKIIEEGKRENIN